jgi:hypothetical protein
MDQGPLACNGSILAHDGESKQKIHRQNQRQKKPEHSRLRLVVWNMKGKRLHYN